MAFLRACINAFEQSAYDLQVILQFSESMTVKVSAKFDAGNVEVIAIPCGRAQFLYVAAFQPICAAGSGRERPQKHSIEDQAGSIL